MTTSRLLHERMREKGYSKIRLLNEVIGNIEYIG